MTSQQYEELCRFFIARELKIEIDQVVSRLIANPCRELEPDSFEASPYKHQIDLYWEIEDGLARYVNIANAKWRGHHRVRQAEVLLLQKVREKVAAHKAFMITNSGFTGRARQVALDEGISLLIVRPLFDSRALHPTRRPLILQRIQQLARKLRPPYHYQVCHKSCTMLTPAEREWLHKTEAYFKAPDDMDDESRRRAGIPVKLEDIPEPPERSQVPGALPSPCGAAAPGLGGYATRQGPGLGFRTK